MYGTGMAILGANIFRGPGQDVKSGKYVARFSNGYIVVYRDGEAIAGCQPSATTVDGITGLEFTEPEYQKCNRTRQKCVTMIQRWVKLNRETVYPKRA